MKRNCLLAGIIILSVTALVAGAKPTGHISGAGSSNEALLPEITNCTTQNGISYSQDTSPYHKFNVYLPLGNGPFPALVYIHGGGWVGGSRNEYDPLGTFYAKRGIAGFSIDYTLTTQTKSCWPAAIQDVISAIRYIRANAQQFRIDPERIAVMGDSAGGHLAALAGLLSGNEPFLGEASGNPRISSHISLIVDYYGPTDLQLVGESEESTVCEVATVYWITASFLGEVTYLMNQSLWIEASPSTYISSDAPPFLIAHGTNDTVVPIAVSESFENKLKAAGVATYFVRVEGGDHFILTSEDENLQVRYVLEPLLKKVFNLQHEEPPEFSALIFLSFVLIAVLFAGFVLKRKRDRARRQAGAQDHAHQSYDYAKINC